MNKQNRFTLLELMMVIVVLSAISYVALDAAGSNVNQVRYEETRQRLKNIRTAILGPTGQAVWEHGILSGFVVDNGRLPENIDELVNKPNGYRDFDSIAPVFNPKPTAYGYNNAGSPQVKLTGAEFQLMKGHRGSYLAGAFLDERSDGSEHYVFRDGWRTIRADKLEDETNHGWLLEAEIDTNSKLVGWKRLESLGLDGESGTTTPDNGVTKTYEKDIAMHPTINENDWEVSLKTVKLYNREDDDYTLTEELYASLLIYDNTPQSNESDNNEKGRWRRVTTDPLKAGTKIAKNKVEILNFTDASVPIGEHILILCEKNNSGDELFEHPDDPNQPNGAKHYIFSRIKVFPRGGSPEMILEIR